MMHSTVLFCFNVISVTICVCIALTNLSSYVRWECAVENILRDNADATFVLLEMGCGMNVCGISQNINEFHYTIGLKPFYSLFFVKTTNACRYRMSDKKCNKCCKMCISHTESAH